MVCLAKNIIYIFTRNSTIVIVFVIKFVWKLQRDKANEPHNESMGKNY